MLPYKFSDLMVYSFGFYEISKKKISKIFKKSNFGALQKAPGSFLSQNILASPPIITQELSKKKKKVEIFTIVFFLTDS